MKSQGALDNFMSISFSQFKGKKKNCYYFAPLVLTFFLQTKSLDSFFRSKTIAAILQNDHETYHKLSFIEVLAI